MAKDISLQSFTVENFGGISDTQPIVLYVGEAFASKKNIAIASGDEGTGKTSWLTALMGLLGQSFDIKEENFVNQETKKINASFEFEYKGNQYKVTWTKSAFKLQKKELNELTDKTVWRDELSPVATLKNIIGYIGNSPMNLKTKDGAKQVEEIRKALSITGDIQIEEKKLLTAFDTAKRSRTDANREYERLKKALEANDLYINWEESEKAYAEIKNSATEKQKLQALELKKNQFTQAQQKLGTITLQISNTKDEIEELELKLQQKKVELTMLEESETKGQKFVSDNKGIVTEYETAQEAYLNIEKYLAEQTQWNKVKEQKSEMDEFQEVVIQLDSRKDELKQQLLDIGKKGLPAIEGLEVITTDAIEGRDVGVYLDGKNVYQLSESQLWTLFLKIWETQDVKYVFVENVSSLGSHAIETLNELATNNVKIFASKMERGSEFKITMTDKIE